MTTSFLGPTDRLLERPFTAPELTASDLAILGDMVARLRRHVRDVHQASGMPVARDDRFTDPDDRAAHKIVITDTVRVSEPGDLVVVGFFGQARVDVDHGPIIELEGSLIDAMPTERQPLVYHNVSWPGRGWGNLVLFASEADKAGWGAQAMHADAVARSPSHYHSIRLHNGVLPGGLAGGDPVRLVRTRYLDYTGSRPWRATRVY